MSKIIAIGGVSRSGKSYLANWLHRQLPGSMVLSQDDFPQREDLIPRIKDRTDWEHPDSINWTLWQKAIEANQAESSYLILEGLFMFYPSALPVNPDFAYYLSMDRKDFIKARQLESRWGSEPLWFVEHVWQSHFEYGLPDSSSDFAISKYHKISNHDYNEILEAITS